MTETANAPSASETVQKATTRRVSPLIVVLLVVSAALLIASMRLPWWSITMWAPQYPQGLTATATLTAIVGEDVPEIDELNHYIGMMPLNEAAQFERSISIPVVIAMAAALIISIWPRNWLRWVLRLPAVIFPVFFLADLKFWLWYAGNNLDPSAALSSTLSAFTPTAIGWGKVAQFHTYGWLQAGFWLALAAAVLTLLTLIPLRRKGKAA